MTPASYAIEAGRLDEYAHITLIVSNRAIVGHYACFEYHLPRCHIPRHDISFKYYADGRHMNILFVTPSPLIYFHASSRHFIILHCLALMRLNRPLYAAAINIYHTKNTPSLPSLSFVINGLFRAARAINTPLAFINTRHYAITNTAALLAPCHTPFNATLFSPRRHYECRRRHHVICYAEMLLFFFFFCAHWTFQHINNTLICH